MACRPGKGDLVVVEQPFEIGLLQPNGELRLSAVCRPPSERYRQLIRELAACAKIMNAEGESLEAFTDALFAVIQFLQGDRAVAESAATRPLVRLGQVLHDLIRGAKPAVLFDRPSRGNPTKPTNLTRDVIRGQLAGAADLLIRVGMPRIGASTWIARQLKERGITDDGKSIGASQILRWRNTVNDGTAPDAQKRAAANVRRRFGASDRLEAERQALILIQTVERLGFRESPPASRK